jgi:hypothetical protein
MTIPIAISIPQPRLRSGGAVFPPQISGAQATIAADFVGGQYWASAAAQASFAAWIAALGATFTRASTATYIDGGIVKTAAVNTARIGSNGLWLTGPATNLCLQSNAFTTAPWSTQASPVIVPNATISPDGTANAWSIKTTVGQASALQQLNATTFTASPQTLTFFVKQLNAPSFVIQVIDQTAGATTLYLAQFTWQVSGPPTLSFSQGTGTTVFTQLANGWWRFDMTFTGTVNGNQFRLLVYPESTGPGTGVGNYFYGFQITNTAFGVDYISTTTVSVTQAADNFNFPYAQSTYSALVTTASGMTMPALGNSRLLGAAPSPVEPMYVPGPATIRVITQNAASVALNSPISTNNLTDANKAMVAGSPTGRSVTLNGLAPNTDANPVGAPTTLYLGNNAASGAPMYGNFTAVSLWTGIVATAADMIYLTGGPPPPPWLPTISGAFASLYADFTSPSNYYYNGARSDFNAWLSAIGGTYTRASSATYVDGGILKTAAPNVPRIGSNGLRLTGPGTNLLKQSNNFLDASWIGFGGGTIFAVQNVTGPDGIANSAWSITQTGGSGGILQTIGNTWSTPGIASAWVRAPSGTISGKIMPQGNDFTTNVTSFVADGTWRRVVSPGDAAPIAGMGRYLMLLWPSGVPLQVFGAQLEASLFATDYIPTTTATVTQAADNLNWPFAQSTFSALVGTSGFVPDGTGSQRVIGLTASGNPTPIFINNGTSFGAFGGAVFISTNVASVANSNKEMFVGSASNSWITANGAVPANQAASMFAGSPTVLALGNNGGGAGFGNGNYSQLAIWNGIVASTAEMQRLTT